jgi:hypothetical protein
MGRLAVVLDPDVAVTPTAFAAAWDSDEETHAVGVATVERAAPEHFFGVVDLVVVPLAVNLATNVITALVVKLMTGLRHEQPKRPEIEIVEITQKNGDRIVFVRLDGRRK